MKFLNIKMQKHYLYVKIKSGDKMYVLASDYDGTLKTRIHDLRINIKSLKKFRSLGNKFIIVTGRSFESIKKEIDEFEIPFDYLSCNDGAVSFNDSLEVIDAKYIKTINFETILYILKKYPGFHIGGFLMSPPLLILLLFRLDTPMLLFPPGDRRVSAPCPPRSSCFPDRGASCA